MRRGGPRIPGTSQAWRPALAQHAGWPFAPRCKPQACQTVAGARAQRYPRSASPKTSGPPRSGRTTLASLRHARTLPGSDRRSPLPPDGILRLACIRYCSPCLCCASISVLMDRRATLSLSGQSQPPLSNDDPTDRTAGSHPLHAGVRRFHHFLKSSAPVRSKQHIGAHATSQ
jgi:hypothetical protein